MAEETYLSDDLLRQLMSVGEVDLLVGIPSHNNAATIAQVAQVVETSFQQNFVRDRVAILNVDGGSTDETYEIFRSSGARPTVGRKGLSSLRTVHRISSQYAPTSTNGSAVRSILASADLLRAKACAVVSPATATLTPDWIAKLLRPSYREGFQFVAPLYARGKHQALLVRNLLYPMSRAVFGSTLREWYSEEWGISGSFASQCIDSGAWRDEAVQARPEAWMAIGAVCSGQKVCQVFLGEKPPRPAGAGPDIVEAIRQTVGNLFWCMQANESHWLDRAGSQPVPTFGPDHELTDDTQPANPEKMFELFRNGAKELEPLFSQLLSADTHTAIREISARDQAGFRFPSGLWIKALYEFAAAFHHGVMNRDHVVQALVPLYRGFTYSFLLEHADVSAADLEAVSEELCTEFERYKSYLVERWKTKAEVKS